VSLAKQSNPDAENDAATLIAETARSAQNAHRYRALATTVADPVFDRVLALGSEIRRATHKRMTATIPAVLKELRSLRRCCEERIREVRAGTAYRELVAAYTGGSVTCATTLAAEIFTDVTVESPSQLLQWAVPLAGRRSDEHFVPPERCARSIQIWATSGITAPLEPPDMGGDDTIRPLRLTEAPDHSESPIALAFTTGELPGPVGRLGERGIRLWYAKQLRVPFTVHAAPTIDDEWWEVRPAAYESYVAALRPALTAARITLVIAPSEA